MAPISLHQLLCQLLVFFVWIFRQSICTYTCEEWNRRLPSSAFTLTSQSIFTTYTRPVIRVKYFDHFQIFLWKILGQSVGASATNAVFNGIPGLSESRQPSHWVTNQIRATRQCRIAPHISSSFIVIFFFPSSSNQHTNQSYNQKQPKTMNILSQTLNFGRRVITMVNGHLMVLVMPLYGYIVTPGIGQA